MKYRSFLIASVALATAFALSGCSHGGPGSETVATIAGQPITQQQLFDYLQRDSQVEVMTQQGVPVNANTVGTVGFQAIKSLIVNRVLEQIAKEENVYPTTQQVDAELERAKVGNPQIVSQALAAGYTIDSLKSEFLDQLCRFNIITKGVTVTPTEVDNFIKENPQDFETPPQVDMQMVVVANDQAKTAVDKAIQSGKSFTEVAQTYTTQPNAAQQNYMFPGHNIPQLPKALQDLIAKTPELQTTPWVKVTEGWVKFYIQKKSPAQKKPVDAATQENVRRALMQQRGLNANDLNKLIAQKIQADQDQIKILTKMYQGPWDQFMQTLTHSLQQQANQTGANPLGQSTPGQGPSTPAAPTTGAAPAATTGAPAATTGKP